MEHPAAFKVSAILLAAGLSSRMGRGRDKLLLPYRGQTLLQRAVALMAGLPLSERVLVTTPARLERIALPPEVRVIVNDRPQAGQSESLRLGLLAATGEGYLFLAADQPRLTPASLLPLLELAANNPDKIIFPAANGKPTTPTFFPARFRAELLAQTGDAGGRAVRAAHPQDCVALQAQSPGDFMDVDCDEDYRAL